MTLPDDPEVRSAAHYLGCDKLDIPLKQADDALTPLFVQVAQGQKAKPASFDKVLTLLRTALNAAFEQSHSAGNP